MTPENKEVFEELLANCADEPIRFPGAIQPHGVLLMLSEPDFTIRQVSANVLQLMGHDPHRLLGQTLDALLGLEQAEGDPRCLSHRPGKRQRAGGHRRKPAAL